jgi:DNA-binding beta-propeller fold protein YncE
VGGQICARLYNSAIKYPGAEPVKKNGLIFFVSMLLMIGCRGTASTPEALTESAAPAEPTIQPASTNTPGPAPTTDELSAAGFLLTIKSSPKALKDPYGIAINSAGLIYVTDAGNSRVLIFDQNANLISEWGARGSEAGKFNSMGFGGLAIDSKDNVFVVDNGNHRIQKFDRDGNFLLEWGSSGKEDGQFVRAIGIAIDGDDNVYVTDDGNPFVQKFDNNGSFLMKFGGNGQGNGQFLHATGIAVDAQGNIFVADYEARRIQKFDSNGVFITTWIMGDDIGVQGIPEAIAVDADGNVYVSDYRLGRIQVFDTDGVFLRALSSASIASPFFKRPTGIAFDDQNRIYVVNQSGAAVSVFQLP